MGVSLKSQFVADGFRGTPVLLAAGDIAEVAGWLHCPQVNLRAVLAVETSGRGFDQDSRPAMLFEPHLFYANLKHADPAKLNAAVVQGLAYAEWGARAYPLDSYPHLLAACAIDEAAALMSASWGIGQILGENYDRVGYLSVQAMVQDAMKGEAKQLDMMGRFIVSCGLEAALAAGDWAKFARAYNGPDYARDRYDAKLAAYVWAHATLTALSDAHASAAWLGAVQQPRAARPATHAPDAADALNDAELNALAATAPQT